MVFADHSLAVKVLIAHGLVIVCLSFQYTKLGDKHTYTYIQTYIYVVYLKSKHMLTSYGYPKFIFSAI